MEKKYVIVGIALIIILGLGIGYIAFQQSPPVSQENEYANPNALVTPDWLENNLDDPNIRIIDLSYDYYEGHIKNSVFVDWIDDTTDPEDVERYTIAKKEAIESLLSRISVKEDTIIILVDDLQNRISMRMFWVLKYYGHEDIRILDGGRVAWENAGKSYTDEIPEISETNYKVAKVNEQHRVKFDFIKDNFDSPDVVLIDNRGPAQYSGEKAGAVYNTGEKHKRKGHIPGAINVPWNDNLKEDDTFKSYQELLKEYKDKGIAKDKFVITYCNEGLHAAASWFVLSELLGYPKVSVYDESMAEWANRDDVPMTMGPNP